jgi:hypothetical protein
MHANLLDQDATAQQGSSSAAIAWRWKGQLHLTVIVKATFAFASEAAMSRAAAQPILGGEAHHGRNPGRSIRFSTDLVPALSRADVLFTGSAHAPPGLATQSLTVRVALFGGQRPLLDKRLLVRDPGGFQQRFPLVYERAGRGEGGLENPFGVAESASPPQIVNPENPRAPAGFGPIARSWPARRRLLGATPRKALDGPIAEIPDAFDWSYFQAAPPDQQTEILRGDEWILLEGLHPTLPFFRTQLPSARARARIHGLGGAGIEEGTELDLRADSLHIDGDEQQCNVVWRAHLALAGEPALAAIRVATGFEAAGEGAVWSAPRGLSLRSEDANRSAEITGAGSPETVALLPGALGASGLAAATPFRPGAAAAAESTAALPPSVRAPAVAIATGTLALDAGSTLALDPGAAMPPIPAPALPFGTLAVMPAREPVAPPRALPFQPAAAAPAIAAPRAPAPPPEHVETGTLVFLADDGAPARSAAALPFAGPFEASTIEDEPTFIASTPVPIAAAAAPEPELPTSDPPVAEIAPLSADRPVVVIAAPASPWAPAPPALPLPPEPPRERPTTPRPSPDLRRNLYSRFERKS